MVYRLTSDFNIIIAYAPAGVKPEMSFSESGVPFRVWRVKSGEPFQRVEGEEWRAFPECAGWRVKSGVLRTWLIQITGVSSELGLVMLTWRVVSLG